MTRPLSHRKLSRKEAFDIRTMLYFISPSQRLPGQIRHNDKIKMADLSSRGTRPSRETNGFKNLLWGKTYRDNQITEWRRDIRLGLITKAEIYESVPVWMLDWTISKLRDVPYDVDGKSTQMFLTIHRREARDA